MSPLVTLYNRYAFLDTLFCFFWVTCFAFWKKNSLLLFDASFFFIIYPLKEFDPFTSAKVVDARETCLSDWGSACSLFENLSGGRLTMDREWAELYPTTDITRLGISSTNDTSRQPATNFSLNRLSLFLSILPVRNQYDTVCSCRIRQDPLYLVYTLIMCWKIRFIVYLCWIYRQQKKFSHKKNTFIKKDL